MSARPDIDLAARCACGAIGVHAAGRVLSMLLCACEDCQKATGTGHSAAVMMRATDVSITGTPGRFETRANSGATYARHFCAACGTPIHGRSSRAPDIVALPVGLFGAAAAGWFAPGQTIFARSHRGWDTLPPGIALHATYRGEAG